MFTVSVIAFHRRPINTHTGKVYSINAEIVCLETVTTTGFLKPAVACSFFVWHTGPSPRFSSRGGQKPKRGAKSKKGGPIFLNAALDVCSNRWAKREMGGNRFQKGGQGTTGPPAGDGPGGIESREK